MASGVAGAFIQRWCHRASLDDDPFDQFFSLWIALVVSACPQLAPEDFRRDDTDRRAILRLSASCRAAIFSQIDSLKDELSWLAKRKGTRRGDPIVDVHDSATRSAHLRELFKKLAEHYSGRDRMKPGRVVDAVIELLNHVRNNLFHGVKDPTDVDDRELLQRLNPLLRAVLRGAAQ